MITYKYARGKDNKLIDICSLNGKCKNDFEFYCIACGNELIAKLGRVNVHHFAHKKIVTCSVETYLHALGKQLFFETYTKCLIEKTPFFIEIYRERTCNHYADELGQKCKLPKDLQKFDLTQSFDKISIEKREGDFIADILLSSTKVLEKVFVEIAVTHISTELKLNSNYRIIEIKIQVEEDFESIRNRFLSVTESNVKFKNFRPKELNTSICIGNCEVNYNLFTLESDGRCLLRQRNLKQIQKQLNLSTEKIVKYQISKDCGYNYSLIFKKGLATFSMQNLQVKNCFLCRYHAENNSWLYFIDTTGEPIFCKFLKIKCNSNQAVVCDYFKLDNKCVQDIIESIDKVEEDGEFDI